MFCAHCGKQLTEDTRFCPACGTGVTKEEISVPQASVAPLTDEASLKTALIRRAGNITDRWDIFPSLPGDNLKFDYERIRRFDPLYRLAELRRCILDTCMEVTGYQYDESFFSDVVEEVYSKRENEFQKAILQWLIEDFKRASGHFMLHYSDSGAMDFLMKDVHDVFLYAHCIITISCKLKCWDGLLYARKILDALTWFTCEKTTNFGEGMTIYKSGKLLCLPQFAHIQSVYNQLNAYIEKIITQYAPKESLDKLREVQKKEMAENIKKEQKSSSLIACKVVFCIFQPVLCLLAFLLLMALEVVNPYDDVVGAAFVISFVALWIAGIMTNIKAKRKRTIILFSILYAILWYPLYLLISLTMAIAIVVGILLLLGFIKFIRS